MNPTIDKFGYPATLVREYQHWLVLVRPAQVTLGSLVLAAKSDATAYRDLPPPLKELIDWDQQRLDVEVKYETVAAHFAPHRLRPSEPEGEGLVRPLGGPLELDGVLIGAVGVSGGSAEEDQRAVDAGVRAIAGG